MAVVASDRLTLATLRAPTYVRTFYLKQSSTLNPPGVPTANPPGGNWSTTEPTFVQNETATVYTVMLTAYGANDFEYGPVQKSSSFEAAKQAYNQAVASGQSADDAFQKALDAQNDLANLQIGGRNYFEYVYLSDRNNFLPGTYVSSKKVWDLEPNTEYILHAKQLIEMPVGDGHYVLDICDGTNGSLVWGDPDHTIIRNVYNSRNMTTPVENFRRTFTTPASGRVFFSFYDDGKRGQVEEGFWFTDQLVLAKLERGTKATDWTPAPEDVDASIVAVGDKAKADLDALEVGGRNYMLNSAQPKGEFFMASNNSATSPVQQGTDEIGQWITGTRAATGNFFLTTYTNPSFENGRGTTFSEGFFPIPDVYTQSVEVMSEVAMTVQLGNTDTTEPIKPNEWTRIHRTLTPSDTNAHRMRLWGPSVLETPDVPVGTKLYVRNWKLEKGNKATDWSPATEDVVADAQAKADLAKQAAIDAAEAHANLVAQGASQDAIDAAALDAQAKADLAKQAAIDASVPKILSKTGSSKTFRDLANFSYRSTTSEDAIVIRTPITASVKMCSIKIAGYNFRSTMSEINLMVNFYAYTSSSPFHTPTYTSSGNFVVNVQGGVNATTGDLELILTPPANDFIWRYPDVSVPEASFSYNIAPDHWADGWQISMVPLSEIAVGERYSTLVNFPMAGPQAVADDARTKAEDALAGLATRPTKSYVDDQIILSANGKNSITTSLNAPSGSGVENGDLWRRHDSAGHVYQEFTWRDGAWRATRVTSEMVTNMDIHKLTVSGDASFSALVADEIWSEVVKTELAVATEVIAGDAIIKNTLEADKLVAKTIKADSGVIDDLAIVEAHIGNSSVTNAKIKNLDAAKITSGFIDAARLESRTIAAEKLLLGSFDNFFHDPRFEDERGYSPGVVVGETLRINAGQTVNVSWLAMPVDKDESYTVRFRKTGSGNLTFAIHSATKPSGPYSLVGDSFNTATEEGDFEFTVTADKPYIRWVVSNTTAQSFISEIKIRKVFTGIRLEDGIITTEKIQADSIVSDLIQADAIHSEHMGANSVMATSIGAGQITGNHIDAGTITSQHIEAGTIKAGNIEAGAITAEELHLGAVTYDKIALGAVRGEHLREITKDQFMNAIDDDLSGIIDSAETISDSVIITPGEIRLTTEVESSGTTTNETALSLTSTRQTFIVDGKDVVYIDSEEESMNIRNVVVDDSIQVGNHIIEKISDDITAFMWAGDR